MAHTVPDDFISPADAFKHAVEALCTALAPCIEATAPALPEDKGGPRGAPLELSTLLAKEGPTREANAFEKNDQAEREIENGQLERLVEREGFREMSFGIPGFENVPHHLTSPGEDTGNQPALLRKSNFHDWLSAQRGDRLHPFRTGAPGKPSAKKIVKGEHERRLSAGEAHEKVSEEAAHLKKWLQDEYPDAPETSKRTIENQIREAHRGGLNLHQ
jgi:hypothetical protein